MAGHKPPWDGVAGPSDAAETALNGKNQTPRLVADDAAAGGPMIKLLEVTWSDWQCHILLPGGGSQRVSMNGSFRLPPLANWRPIYAISCSDLIILLEWESDEGGHGTWFLGSDMSFLGNVYSNLALEHQTIVENAILGAFGRAWDSIICKPCPNINEEYKTLGKINQGIIKSTLFGNKMHLPELSSDTQDLHDIDPDQSYVINVFGSRVKLESKFLLSLLDYRFETRTTFPTDMSSALKTGKFAWPSPVDGRPLETAHCLPLYDGILAYRVCDKKYGIVFYIICAWGHKAFVYIPAGRQLYFLAGKIKLLAEHFNSIIEQIFIQALVDHSEYIGDYINMPITGFSLVLKVGHIGHHLWNELTEISEILRSETLDFPSNVIVMHGSRVEPLGRMEEIFPALTGRVMRELQTHTELARYCYTQGRCVIEPTTSYITRQLADRIVDVNVAHPDVQPDFADRTRYAAQGYQILLIGLRVENRTDTDLGGFCICVVEAALQVIDRLVVVIDCLNAEFYNAETEFLSAQAAAVRRLSDRFPQGGQVEIVDLTGAPVRRSLFWSRSARCFVAIWGAGLAKYRWLTNRPGLVVTSQWNLLHRADLHIYDSPQYMENPAPIRFIDPRDVQDLPDAPILLVHVLHDRNSIANFHADRDALRRAVQSLLEAAD